jgi:hypothetical protein
LEGRPAANKKLKQKTICFTHGQIINISENNETSEKCKAPDLVLEF